MRKPVSWYLKTVTLAVLTGVALGSGAAMADDKPVRGKGQSWFPTKLKPFPGTIFSSRSLSLGHSYRPLNASMPFRMAR